jgi:hypothetical protein
MKIETNKNLNMFGKKKNFVANLGTWKEEGITVNEAKENLENAIQWYSSESDFYPIIRNANTRIVILNRDFTGYSVSAIEKESAIESYSFYGRITLSEAKRHLESHVNNYIES